MSYYLIERNPRINAWQHCKIYIQVCVEGPAEKLNTTAVSQPAIYVSSLATVEKLRMEKGDDFINSIDVCAGLSLGEYTALAFAGAMSFEDGLKLVKLRGESMQAAADAKPSGTSTFKTKIECGCVCCCFLSSVAVPMSSFRC